MKKGILRVVLSATIGGVLGYFFAASSNITGELQDEIASLRSQLAQATSRKPATASHPRRQLQDLSAPTSIPATAHGPTNIVPWLTAPRDAAEAAKQRGLRDWVNRTAKERDQEYTDLFTELGARPEQVDSFKSHLVQLHRKAIAAGEPLMELVQARHAYDQEMREALGESNYRVYREYEESKPAHREYEAISQFSWTEKGVALNPEYAEEIVNLIKLSGSTTMETWDGPYDPLPRPAFGDEMVAGRMTQKLDELREDSTRLLESLRSSEIPQDYVQYIADYYAKVIRGKERGLSFLQSNRDESFSAFEEDTLQRFQDNP